MSKVVYGLVAAALMTVVLPSCKLFKHKTSKKDKVAAARAIVVADSLSNALKNTAATTDTTAAFNEFISITAPIWQKRIVLKTFSTKAKMHYEGGDKSYDFIANIRLQKDSIIWVSVTVAGIVQVARAIITPDSFKAILYTEKEAYEGPISKVNNIIPAGLDFYSLQNVLLGNPILNKGVVTSVTPEEQYWSILFQEENYIEQAKYDKADSTLRNSSLITQGLSNKSLTHVLSNFSMFNNLKIPLDRRVNIITDSTSMLVEMNYSNISINAEQTYPFSIPKNYTIK